MPNQQHSNSAWSAPFSAITIKTGVAAMSAVMVGAVCLAISGISQAHSPKPPQPPSLAHTAMLPTEAYDRADWVWQLPVNFPTPIVPDDNPMTDAKVELGRHLFYDKRLSGNGTQSCASCHIQKLAFTDGLAQSIGSTGETHPRNAQSLVNIAYSPTLTWANPALVRLETQMQTPIFAEHPVEMGVTDSNKGEILKRIGGDERYRKLYTHAYPNLSTEQISWQQIVDAIASFERSIISADSRYDRYLQGKEILSPQEIRGMNLFHGEKAECFHCHGSFNFNNQVQYVGLRQIEIAFHNTGLYHLDADGSYPAENGGLYEVTAKREDMGKFRAPSLRNVAVTAPYNHDGSVATLEDVLANYAAGGRHIKAGNYAGDGRANPHKDDLIVSIDLSIDEQADIIAFLKTLTDEALLIDPRFSDPFSQ